ncbi:hypothetical protein KJ608_04595 [Patescibacteria group bacterium]|nr:hypothetical protein [Patescibacteria group bacterium]
MQDIFFNEFHHWMLVFVIIILFYYFYLLKTKKISFLLTTTLILTLFLDIALFIFAAGIINIITLFTIVAFVIIILLDYRYLLKAKKTKDILKITTALIIFLGIGLFILSNWMQQEKAPVLFVPTILGLMVILSSIIGLIHSFIKGLNGKIFFCLTATAAVCIVYILLHLMIF